MEEKKICCGMSLFTFDCMKFFVCVIISFVSMAFGMYLLIDDKFKTVAVSSFATSLITNVFSFWVSPPEINPRKREVDEKEELDI